VSKILTVLLIVGMTHEAINSAELCSVRMRLEFEASNGTCKYCTNRETYMYVVGEGGNFEKLLNTHPAVNLVGERSIQRSPVSRKSEAVLDAGAFILDAPFFVERFFGSRRVSASSLDCSAYIPVTPPDEYFVRLSAVTRGKKQSRLMPNFVALSFLHSKESKPYQRDWDIFRLSDRSQKGNLFEIFRV
jgi:hypothetical protein